MGGMKDYCAARHFSTCKIDVEKSKKIMFVITRFVSYKAADLTFKGSCLINTKYTWVSRFTEVDSLIRSVGLSGTKLAH